MIVVPLAGDSKRFKELGIQQPKWSLRLGDTYVLQYALDSVLPLARDHETVLLIVLERDKGTLSHLLDSTNQKNIEVQTIQNPTNGQAETVMSGLRKFGFNSEDRLVIWCGDSYIKRLDSNLITLKKNHLVLSELIGDHWSFAKTLGNRVIETYEKRRVGPYASVGLYYFDTISNFLKLKLEKTGNLKEFYIAPLYNQLIEKNNEVTFTLIPSEDFLSLGTPRELITSSEKLGVPINRLIFE